MSDQGGREWGWKADWRVLDVGEISGINNCSAILTDPEGEFQLSPQGALDAFKQLSLYTNAEPCPMVMLRPSVISFGHVQG